MVIANKAGGITVIEAGGPMDNLKKIKKLIEEQMDVTEITSYKFKHLESAYEKICFVIYLSKNYKSEE